jgi:hypothetical protein
MGKATILENIGAGRYRIKVHFDNAQVDALLAYNESIIVTLESQIADNAIKKTEAWDDYQYHLSYLTNFIVSAGPKAIVARQDEVNHAMATVTTKKMAYDKAAHTEALSKLRLEKAKKEVAYLTKYCPKEIEAYAWCVAYNEDLTGEVATIEIDYHIKRNPSSNQIMFNPFRVSPVPIVYNNPDHDKTGFWLLDGGAPTSILQHPLASSVHAVWYNICMLPAAQRWKPYYRIAQILVIHEDTNKANIAISGDYNVNKYSEELTGPAPIVPEFDVTQQVLYIDANVSYMGSGVETFMVGDWVIVDLHGGVGVPTVIGYYENPRPGAIYIFDSNTVNVPNETGKPYMRAGGSYHFAINDLLINHTDYTVTMNGITLDYSPMSGGGGQWSSLVSDAIRYFRLASNERFEMMYRDAKPMTPVIHLIFEKSGEVVCNMSLTSVFWPSTTNGLDVNNVAMTCLQPPGLLVFGSSLDAIEMVSS